MSSDVVKIKKFPKGGFILALTAFKRTLWVPIVWSVLLVVITTLIAPFGYYGNEYLGPAFTKIVNDMEGDIIGQCIISVIISAVFGAVQFSFLARNSSVGFIHSLPVKRKDVFLSYYLSGAVSVVIPQIAMALVFLATAYSHNLTRAFIAFAVGSIYSVGAYSFAVMMSRFSANVLGGIVFSGFFLAVPAIVEAFIRVVMEEGLYGYYGDSYNWIIQYLYLSPKMIILNLGWLYYLLATAIFVTLAFLLYRKHPSETAGDLIAFPKIRGIATVICGVLAGFCGYLTFGNSFIYFGIFGSICAVLVNFAIKKKFSFVSSAEYAGAICLIAFAIYGIFAFDLTGFVNRVPEASKVESVIVHEGYTNRAYQEIYINGHKYNTSDEPYRIKDSEDIEKVIDLHKDLIGNRNYYQWGTVEVATRSYISPYYDAGDSENIIIEYNLKNGKKLIREYRAYYGKNRDTLEAVLSLPEMKMQEHPVLREDAVAFRADVFGALETVYLDEEKTSILEDAVTRDIIALGKDDVRKLYGYRASSASVLRIRFEYSYTRAYDSDGNEVKNLDSSKYKWEDTNVVWIYPEFTETLTALRDMGYGRLIDFSEIPSHYEISVEKHHSPNGISTDVYYPQYVFDDEFKTKLLKYAFDASAEKLNTSDNTAYRIVLENKNKETTSEIMIFGEVDFIEAFIAERNPERDSNASYKGVPYMVKDYDKLVPEITSIG